MLTGPDEVDRRRERIWAVPFNCGGSMEDRSKRHTLGNLWGKLHKVHRDWSKEL